MSTPPIFEFASCHVSEKVTIHNSKMSQESMYFSGVTLASKDSEIKSTQHRGLRRT